MPKDAMSTPPVLAGLTFVRPLGSGGFADVFLYEQAMPRRHVAVKVLPSNVADAELLRMFNAEADVLARLSAHPAIVTVYQAGISADGRAFISMEYCPGALSPRYRTEKIPVPEAISIGIKMAGAIESAHRAGLVHRDIKPGNILTTTFGTPVLADFGIASAIARSAPDEMMAMSVPWTAPEVIAEQNSGDVASEVWSLGATVYSLIAGHSPFERPEKGQNTRELLRKRILKATYTPLTRPDVPPALQQVLEISMRKAPRERYQTALAFAEALRQVEYAVGLAPTSVDLADEGWAAPVVNFADDSARDHVRARVEVVSERKQRAAGALASHHRAEDSEYVPAFSKGRRNTVWLVIGAIVLVAAGVTAGIVIGNM